MERLTICIPTFNREKPLIKNVDLLLEYIKEYKIQKRVSIVIYDNYSKNYSLIKKKYGNNPIIELYQQEETVSAERNFVSVIEVAKTDWVMLLGDDDYIDGKYLNLVMEYIVDKNISAIIPNYYVIDGYGNKINGEKCRDLITDDVIYVRGNYEIMFKAHQMSGLVFRKKGVLESYQANVKPNAYCQMYFIGFNIARGECIHVTRYPLANTVITKKSVKYGIDMLLQHILYNVNGLPVNNKRKNELSKYIIRKDTLGRLGNKKSWTHPIKMIHKLLGYDEFLKIRMYLIYRFLLSYFLYFNFLINKVKGEES